MTYDFDALVAEVLRSRPELDKEALAHLIAEKKSGVGAGYLTDQGALFLIAGELGVQLQQMVSSDLTLKDLYVGANDITVVARVLAVYPISEFRKKDGSGTGRYRRVNLFDRNGVAKLTIWEDNEEAMKFSGIGVDAPVRIVSGYVRQGYDNKPALNLGKRGKVDTVVDASIASKLPLLSTLSRRLAEIKESEDAPLVEGMATSDSRTSSFSREDGSGGSLMQFELAGIGGEKEKATKMRIVIWNGDAGLPQVKSGQQVSVTNLRCRKGRQGELELHGDGGSVVRLQVAKSSAMSAGTEAVERVIEVVAAKKMTGKVSLEVMALSKGSVREVSMKDGSMMKKGEVVVGDGTGEITLVAWKEASKTIGEIQAGEKLRIRGVTVQISRMGVETLELGESSAVEKVLVREGAAPGVRRA